MPMQNFEEAGFPGGLILQRSSAAAPGSLIELTNGIVTQEGIIRSRGGSVRLNVTPLDDGAAGTQVHSLVWHGTSSYFGVSTVIKRAFTTDIVTGLSGLRTTFARMSPSSAVSGKEFTYFANATYNGTFGAATGDGRKKDDGSNVFNWGLDGPTASLVAALTPTVTTDQPATTAIDAFANAYTAQDGFGTEAVAALPYATSARSFTVPSGKIERYRRTGLTLDLSTRGQNGFIRIMLRTNNRQNLDHVELAFSAGTDAGTFTNDYYTTRIRALDFTADNTWQEFRIRKPDFTRVKLTSGSAKTWADIVAVQVTVGANGKGEVIVSADDARVEADTHVEGRVAYRITLWNDTLKTRSNAKRLVDDYAGTDYTTADVLAVRQRVVVPRPAIGAWDAAATHWELWRRNEEVSGEFFFVARILRATASYDDDKAEHELGDPLVEDNHIPPAAQFVLEYDERLFLFGMDQGTSGSGEEEARYTIRWSKRGYPESFPKNQYQLVSDPTDPIMGGCVWAGSIYLFTKNRIRSLAGSGGTYTLRETEAPTGTPSGFSIGVSAQGIFYRAIDGVYLFSGNTAQKISEAVDPIFYGDATVVDQVTITPLNLSSLAYNVIGTVALGYYVFVYTDTGGNRQVLFYEIATGKWSRQTNGTANSGWFITGLHWVRTDAGVPIITPLRAGTNSGWVVHVPVTEHMGSVTADAGPANIPFAVQLKAWDTELKSSDVETDFKDIVVDANTGNEVLTVQVSFDGAAYVTLGTVQTTVRDKVYLPINSGVGTIAFRCAVRITGSLSTARVLLYAVGTQHIPEPQRLLDSSTDYDQQGWPGEKILQELQIEANTFSTAVVVTVEVDGVDLAQTFSLNTALRKHVVFSFNIENPRGTNLRLKWNGSVESKIYGYKFQFLKEPLSITKLETEVSDEGWPAEKILQELQITANTHGANVTVTVEIDGVDLSPTFTLNTGAHRDRVFSFAIENARGTNLRLKMECATAWTYYKHEFQYLKEPLSILKLETAVSDEGWPAEKILQELQIVANTHGADVTVTVEIDGVDLSPTFTLNTGVHRDRVFSFPIENARGTMLRLKMSCATTWLYYKHEFQYLKEPLSITKLETAVSDEGWPGPKILQELQIWANTHSANVTVTVEIDGVDLSPTFTLNTAAHRDRVFSFALENARGTNLRLKMECATAWTYYRHKFQVLNEPLTVTKLQTAVTDEGWPAEKILQQFQIIATTGNAVVDVTIDLDGADYSEVFHIPANIEHQATVFSFAIENTRATMIRLEMTSTIAWVYYGHQFQYLKEPLSITKLETAVSDEGWPGEKILQELQITANTHGLPVDVVIEADGTNLGQAFVLNTGAHYSQVFSFNVPHPRATNLRLKMTLRTPETDPWVYYSHKFQFLNEPLSITKIETAIEFLGWPGPKLFRVGELEINTKGTNVSVTVLIDNVIRQTEVVNTGTAHTTVTIEMTTTPEGRAAAIRLTSTATFLYYGWQWTSIVKLPSPVTFYDSTPIALWKGKKGWLGARSQFVVRGTALITVTLYMDDNIKATLTIPTQAARTAVLLILPIGVTGKIAQVKLVSSAPFQIFPEGSYIEAHALDADRESQRWEFVQQEIA